MRRAFIATHRLDRWFRARFTTTGRVLVAVLVAVSLFALNPRASSAWMLTLLILAVLLAAMLWAPWRRPKLALSRELPRFATQGEPCHYQTRIVNQGRWVAHDLSLREWARPSDEQVPRSIAGGYARFVAAIARTIGYWSRPASLPELAPGEEVRVPMTLTALRRGYVELGAMVVEQPDPLGLFNALTHYPLTARLLCLPARHRVVFQPDGGQATTAGEARHARERTGGGLDFARLREYRAGDSLRHVHWRAFARIGEPVVREFHDEIPARSALILDTALPPPANEQVFETAVSVAASFAVDRDWLRGRIDLLLAGDELVSVARGQDSEISIRMLEALALVNASVDDGFIETSGLVERTLGQFSRVVCVMLALDEPRARMLKALHRAGTELIVVHVHEPNQAPAASEFEFNVLNVPAGRAEEALASISLSKTNTGVASYA